ncbi:MAG: hypothetical protein WCT20_04485 [Candidatus Babeliales bacterium]
MKNKNYLRCLLPLIMGLIFFGGCGKQRPLTLEETETVICKAKQVEQVVAEKYRQELRMVRAAVPFEKIQIKLSGLVGMMQFKKRFIDFIDGRNGPDKVPFHFYQRVIADDIDNLKTINSQLKRTYVQDATLVSENIKKLLADLSVLNLYVLRHSEYRAEERYMQMLFNR